MTAFLQNALGFFVQFFPCAIMLFLAFPKEDYRFNCKRIFSALTLAVMIFAALFPPAIRVGIAGNTALTANLFMFSAIFLILAYYIWLVRESLIKKLLVFFVVIFYAAMQYCLVNALNGLLSGFLNFPQEHEEWAVYTPHGLALYIITTAVLLPPMLTFITRTLREYILEVETQDMRQEFFILIVSTAALIAMMICVDFTYYYLEYKVYLLVLTLFFVLLLYQMIICWLVFRESVRRKRDNERRRTLEIQQLQYEKIASDMENTRRMRHDLHHHFNALNDMLGRGEINEMKAYLSGMIDTTVKRDSKAYCKNMTLNGLLQYYTGLAGDEGIRCEVQAECDELTIEPADLTVLFGNAMENAINACKKCTENRMISIRVGTVHGSLAIEISNSCKEARINRRFQAENGFSPAEAFLSARPGGGHGLRSIVHTAQKYDGSAKFRFNAEQEIFTTRIRLNMQVKKQDMLN